MNRRSFFTRLTGSVAAIAARNALPMLSARILPISAAKLTARSIPCSAIGSVSASQITGVITASRIASVQSSVWISR
jgi:hypothetical protein